MNLVTDESTLNPLRLSIFVDVKLPRFFPIHSRVVRKFACHLKQRPQRPVISMDDLS